MICPYCLNEIKPVFESRGEVSFYTCPRDEMENKRIMKEKIRQLKNISLEIENWLMEQGAGSFVKIAKDSFRSVEYTIVSAFGNAPITFRLDPRRARDPFLWILEKAG